MKTHSRARRGGEAPPENHPDLDDMIDASVDPETDQALDFERMPGERDLLVDDDADEEPAAASTRPGSVGLPRDTGRVLVLGAAGLALLTGLVLAIVGPGWVVVILHAVVVALATTGWVRMRADMVADDHWRLLALAVAALGAIGAIGAGAVALLARRRTRGAVREQPKRAPLAMDDAAGSLDDVDASVEATLARRAHVVPFADVLARGTTEQKQEMIAVIASNFQPSFARALHGAMNDAEPAVRMMAAAAASRIEGELLETSMALESTWAEQPGDVHHALELARHYDAFAATGVLDESRALEARLRALELYQQAALELPRDTGLAQAIVRLLLKLGREEEAIGLFQRRMDDGTAPPALTSWYLECLYRRRRFGDLRRHAAAASVRIRDLDTLHPRSVDAMQLWAVGPKRNQALVPVDAQLDDGAADTASDGGNERALDTPQPRRQRAKFELPYFRPNYPT